MKRLERILSHPMISRALLVVGVIGLAVIAGQQIANPDKRVLQVLAAGMVIYLAFRTESISALMLAVLLIPFPKATSYGNTNVAFVLLIFIVWLFRVSTGRAKAVGRTPFDIPLLCLVMAYAISFYNVEPQHLAIAWAKFAAFLSYLFLFYMVVNIVQTTDHARKLLLVQAVSCFLICAIAVYEQSHPGGVIVPGWIEFTGTMEVRGEGVRVGSTFLDYELLAEYCALNLVLQLFMWVRATSRSRRVAVTLLMALTLFVLFATVTRGALVALGVGLLYLGWLSRKRLNFPKLVIGVAAVVAVIGTADWAVSTFTRSKSVLQRLEKTEFVGVVPESRVGAWEYAIRNISEHPIIGHGPFYSTESGVVARYWTHNVYLYYASIVGVVGLAAFLWFLWRLWWANARRAPSMGSGSYIAGFSLTTRVVLLVFIVDQLKIDYLRNERYSFFIWFLLGLIAAVSRVATEEATVLATHSSAPPERVPLPTLHAGNSSRRQIPRVAVAHAAGENRP